MPLKSATCGRELEAGLRRRPGSNNVTFDGKPLDGVFVMHRHDARLKPRRARSGTERSTTGGPLRSISDVLLQTSEARRFGGAEPGSRAQGQHANGRSKTELRGVS